MLISLKGEDFYKIVEDKEYLEYGPEKLIIFKKEFTLINLYGIEEKVIIYIKIKMKSEHLPIISFHQDE